MTSERCAACGRLRDPGALLLVVDRHAQRTTETICRYSVEGRCFAWCGSATQTAIAELDPVAAREFDRAANQTPDPETTAHHI